MNANLQKINSKLIDYTAPSDVFVAAMGLRPILTGTQFSVMFRLFILSIISSAH